MDDLIQLALLYEDIQIKRTGAKSVNREDVSNFLFKITDGGREMFRLHTVRKNDSKYDPNKKAGQPMIITGRLGACSATNKASAYRVPALSTKVQYQKNAILRVCVTAVDGIDYIKAYPAADRTRSFDVTNINKIEAGGQIYNVA